MMTTRPHSVYRCYDKHGTLLYVGCARDVEARIGMHQVFSNRNINSWFLRQHMDRYESVEYPDKRTAMKAERNAIREGAPLLNVHHNLGREIDRHIITSISVQAQAKFLEDHAAMRRAA